MIVVLPFCSRDQWLAEKSLLWSAELEPQLDYDCLLFAEVGLELDSIIAAAKKAFKRVHYQLYPKPAIQKWPHAPNAVFKHAIRAVNKAFKGQPWLFLEPDATPIRKGWLRDIETEYLRASKPLMGHIVEGAGHCNGVAVYPPNMEMLCPDIMGQYSIPWDIHMKGRTISRTHKANHLFMRIYERQNGKLSVQNISFKKKEDVSYWVEPGAALFHSSKDGTLIDRLRELHRDKNSLWKKLTFTRLKEETALVMLGRYGDITNILPVAKDLADKSGQAVPFYVSADYADILDGVSYVKPEIIKGDFSKLPPVIDRARKKYADVRVAQVFGHGHALPIQCSSFNEEQWRMVGYRDKFGKLPLVFDRRDYEREAKFCRQFESDKPLLLLNIAGKSSPFKDGAKLKQLLEERHSNYNLVDISEIRAERVYDLLGLMDRAAGLVTIDTSTLHLAAASAVPTVALIVDTKTPWHGTRPLCNAVLSLRYGEVLRNIDRIYRTIEELPSHRETFVHTFADHGGSHPETKRRIEFARSNNRITYRQGGWMSLPQRDEILELFTDQKGKLPFIKSLLDNAFEYAPSNVVVVLTNTDICFEPLATSRLREMMSRKDACYSFRRDFPRLDKQLSSKEVHAGRYYCGTDLFALRRSWWLANRDSYPDMVLGREAWDWCLRELIIATQGKDAAFDNLIYHEKHDSVWEQSGLKESLAGNIHNRKLARDFLTKLGIDLAELKV